jgi:hypothetical protein
MIYKQFVHYVPVGQMEGLQWFSLKPAYGKEYGDIQKRYRFKRPPRLLDIGNGSIRAEVVNRIRPYNARIVQYSDPDEQYSGGPSNKRYHELVKDYFESHYDGTIIQEDHLVGSNEYSEEDLEGPSEIVLWGNLEDLLTEVQSGGRKTKKNGRSKSKKKTVG